MYVSAYAFLSTSLVAVTFSVVFSLYFSSPTVMLVVISDVAFAVFGAGSMLIAPALTLIKYASASVTFDLPLAAVRFTVGAVNVLPSSTSISAAPLTPAFDVACDKPTNAVVIAGVRVFTFGVLTASTLIVFAL